MSVIIGSARIDERGKALGGQAGDQKQSGSGDDYKGEVSLQNFYEHSKGWYVLRPIDPEVANKMAFLMGVACNNKNIGYDQAQRTNIFNTGGVFSDKPTECDCSSLVRCCIKEASGKDVGNFTTGDEPAVLEKSGLFEKRIKYTRGMVLYTGDVLVTCSRGHTVIVTSASERKAAKKVSTSSSSAATATTKTTSSSKITKVAKEVIQGKWGNGVERKEKLTAAGYNYTKIQAEVSKLLGKK